jgi:hypothetical protein
MQAVTQGIDEAAKDDLIRDAVLAKLREYTDLAAGQYRGYTAETYLKQLTAPFETHKGKKIPVLQVLDKMRPRTGKQMIGNITYNGAGSAIRLMIAREKGLIL